MNTNLMHSLNTTYTKKGMDILKALRVWREARLTPDDIKSQVFNDSGRRINAIEARELHHIGTAMQYDYDSVAKQFEVSKGRDDLIPENIKGNKIKLSPAIKMSMEKIGQNLYRHKTARTYWTLKEKQGDNGDKSLFLVAVDDPDEDVQKMAEDTQQQASLPPKQETAPQDPAQNRQAGFFDNKSIGGEVKRILTPKALDEKQKDVAAGIRDYGREMRGV